MGDIDTESEPIPVSSRELANLIKKATANTQQYNFQIDELESKLIAKDEQLKAYSTAYDTLKSEYTKLSTETEKPRKPPRVSPSQLAELMSKMKSTEEELAKNRKKRVEELYNSKYAKEVEETRIRLKKI